MIAFVNILLLPIAWLLDRIFGDPESLPHPIVFFGKCISFADKHFNTQRLRLKSANLLKFYGFFCALVLVVGVFVLSYYLLNFAYSLNFICGTALAIISIFYCLSGRTLVKEVKMVFVAVEESLEKGRLQLSRIVGRDTQELSAQQIRTAALETLAENLSDGVIVPIFWYAILGVPGMLAYKMINTLDSMIGYRNERYASFGFFSAKLDDVANYIPARITAFLMVLVSGKKNKLDMFKFVLKYGCKHASPNSGYPESALAAILNCRFGGTHTYFGKEFYKPYIGENHKDFTFNDMQIAVRVNLYCELLFLLLLIVGNFFYLYL